MTSFAGSKSRNCCGRRGVNSSTASRTVVGSKEDIGWTVADANGETGRRQSGHGDATYWTTHCLIRIAAKAGPWAGCGQRKFGDMVCLRSIHVRSHSPVVASQSRFIATDVD